MHEASEVHCLFKEEKELERERNAADYCIMGNLGPREDSFEKLYSGRKHDQPFNVSCAFGCSPLYDNIIFGYCSSKAKTYY